MINKFLLLFLIFYSFITSGQNIDNNTLIPGIIKHDLINVKTFASIRSENEEVCYSYSFIELHKNDIVIITGPVICSIDNKFYLKALYKGNNVLLDSVDVVSDTNIIEKFKNMDSTKLRSYIDLATLTDNSIMSVDTLNAKKELLEKSKYGLVIIFDKVYDESEFTEGTGFKVKVLNTSKKTIKYITFNYVGYNRVDDPVLQQGKSIITLKGIGPIKYFETGSYVKEYAWFTDIVQYEYIKLITVQYLDGTSKQFKNIQSITLNSNIKKYLEMD